MKRLSLLLTLLITGTLAAQSKSRDRGRFSIQGSAPTVLAVDGTGKYVLGAFDSGQACVWPMEQKVVHLFGFQFDQKYDAKTAPARKAPAVTGGTFLPDGKTFLLSGADGTVKFFDTLAARKHHEECEKNNGDPKPASPAPVKTISAHLANSVVAVSLAADGKTLLTAGSDNVIKVWDVEEAKLLHTVKDVHGVGGIKAILFAPDSKRFATAGADKSAKLWELDGAPPKMLFKLEGHEGAVNSVSFSPDGKRLATGSGVPKKSGSVRVWDTETGKVDYKLEGPQDAVTAVLFSTKGDYLAAGGLDLKILVFTVADKMVKYTDDHSEAPKGFMNTPDGNMFGIWSKGSLRWFSGLGK